MEGFPFWTCSRGHRQQRDATTGVPRMGCTSFESETDHLAPKQVAQGVLIGDLGRC